jgi:glyoxylase-like metal-dependent hydrolase (beta-lactamase superfamily II)
MTASFDAQVPGYYRTHVGDLQITVLSDGFLPAGVAALNNIDQTDARALLDEAFLPAVPLTQTNCFVIHAKGRMALVDTGGGVQHMPKTLGHLFPSMAAAGIDPAAIDTVLLTHIHPDHSYGLVDADNTATFPNALVRLHQAERDFWLDPDAPSFAPPQAQKYIKPANEALVPYRGRIEAFTDGQEVFPGITAVALPGHTPGHSGYRIDSGDESLLIWGDVAHIPEIQLRRPEVGIAFDIDTALAAQTRTRLLDQLATDRTRVAGMHIHFPSFSHVERRREGYGLIPEPWSNLV